MWYSFVETKGYTLEEIARIFETPGLTWKQRRNLKAPRAYQDSITTEEQGDEQKQAGVSVSKSEL